MVSIFGWDLGDISGIFDGVTAKDVIDVVGVGAGILGQNKQTNAAIKAQEAKTAAEIAAQDKAFQQQIELLKLKASLGGGGGGGGGTDMRPIYYQGVLGAKEAQMKSAAEGSALTVSAIKNMMDAAQRPLIK